MNDKAGGIAGADDSGGRARRPLERYVHTQLRALILDSDYTCIGARSALRNGTYRFAMYGEFGSHDAARTLAADLRAFADERSGYGRRFHTFLASFSDPTITGESHFDSLLWRQLQYLHDLDESPWDETVSADPEHADFEFSFAGQAFFVVGLSPASSRWARRFAWPTLVFNGHDQFERLRREGAFEGFRKTIRARDTRLQGDINPNLSDFGNSSDARQYSGRPVDEAWRCPFHASLQTVSVSTEKD